MPILRIATYNLHRGIGFDGQYDPARIVDVARELDADILAFQEVSDRAPIEGMLDLHATLHGIRGYQAVSGPNVNDGTERYGNVLLCRPPIVRSANLDIGVRGFEPRGAIVAEITIGARLVVVVATHLGLRRAERRSQYGMLEDAVAPFQARGIPVLFMGDFNSWLPDEKDLKRLGAGSASRTPATFPAPVPFLALDRIWAVPDIVRRRRAPGSGGARWASDHRPLAAELTV